MSTIVTGQTSADYGNPLRLQTLAGAHLVFYASKDARPSNKVRWGFYPQTDDIDAPELGRTVVKADGSFTARLKPHQGAVIVAIVVERFSYAPPTDKIARGILGVVSLATDSVDGELSVARLAIHLPQAAYCPLLAALDLWLAAGRVLTASTAMGVSGVQVTAFDRDITQDDRLGTATTDATGSFEVFFAGEEFRKLPVLGGILRGLRSLELVGGPDLYFSVHSGTVALLEEAPRTGRTRGRENSKNCSYHELAVPLPGTGDRPGPESGPTVWQAIGDYRVVPQTAGGATDFDPDGFTTVGKRALYSRIKLKGTVFRKYVNGEPIRYRFLVREWSDPRATVGGPGVPSLPPPGATDPDPAVPAGWQALTVGVSGNYGSIVGFVVSGGILTVTSLSLPATPNANGWIEVDQRTLGANEQFIPTGELCRFDTHALVAAGGFAHRKFSIVVQVQTTSLAYQQLPQPIHINNDQVRLAFELAGLGSGCDPFTRSATGTIDISATYEVQHPYLEYYSTYVRRHDGINHQSLSAAETFDPSSPIWLDPSQTSGTAIRTAYPVEPCSYEAGIVARARLTNGETNIDAAGPVDEAFCVR